MVVDIIIAMVLMGAMTDSTKMRMGDRSKTRCFAGCQKISDKADKGTMNQSAICLAKSHTRIPKVQKVINKGGEVMV